MITYYKVSTAGRCWRVSIRRQPGLLKALTWLVAATVLSSLAGQTAWASWSIAGSYPFPQPNVGCCSAMAFDGTSLLFLTQRPDMEDIYFLDPLTGAVQRTLTPGFNETVGSLAWDGGGIWLANVTTGAETLHYIDPTSGGEIKTLPNPAVIGGELLRVEGMAFDGQNLFLAGTDLAGTYAVFEVDPATGTTIDTYVPPSELFGLAYGGGNIMYGAAANDGEIVVFDKRNGHLIERVTAPGSGNTQAIEYDGHRLFVADQDTNTIFVLVPEPATGVMLLVPAALWLASYPRRRASAT